MNKETILGVRKYYSLPDNISGADVVDKCTGTLGEIVVDIEIAKKAFIKACAKSVPKIVCQHFSS